jgi:hypothetical protein
MQDRVASWQRRSFKAHSGLRLIRGQQIGLYKKTAAAAAIFEEVLCNAVCYDTFNGRNGSPSRFQN